MVGPLFDHPTIFSGRFKPYRRTKESPVTPCLVGLTVGYQRDPPLGSFFPPKPNYCLLTRQPSPDLAAAIGTEVCLDALPPSTTLLWLPGFLWNGVWRMTRSLLAALAPLPAPYAHFQQVSHTGHSVPSNVLNIVALPSFSPWASRLTGCVSGGPTPLAFCSASPRHIMANCT